jgi:hypothetical protein
MNRRLRSTLVACVLLAPLGSVGSAARADVGPTDEAAESIQVSRLDGAGGVHVEHGFRGKLPKKVLLSVDVIRVDYDVDRVEQVLTVTYKTRHRAVSVRPYRSYYATVVMADPDDVRAPSVVVLSRPGATTVRVLDLYAEDAGHKCAGGTSVATGRGRVVTVTLPFTCLGDELEHGRLWSGIGLERPRGGDVAYDITRATPDLPLTAYVAPPAD